MTRLRTLAVSELREIAHGSVVNRTSTVTAAVTGLACMISFALHATSRGTPSSSHSPEVVEKNPLRRKLIDLCLPDNTQNRVEETTETECVFTRYLVVNFMMRCVTKR